MKLEGFTVNCPGGHLLAAGILTFQLGQQITTLEGEADGLQWRVLTCQMC